MDKLFDRIISCENLFLAWKEFRRGKRGKTDVQTFEYRLEDNLFDIRSRLLDKSYRHGPYSSFYINDPKSRNIQKARVADRIVHHAIYRALYPTIDGTFIFDSYSCRLGKGTHKAVDRLEGFIRKASKNYRNRCLVLKCDVRKFFDSVDHGILLDAVAKTIKDTDTIWLIREIVQSFASDSQLAVSRERETTPACGRSRYSAAREYLSAIWHRSFLPIFTSIS